MVFLLFNLLKSAIVLNINVIGFLIILVVASSRECGLSGITSGSAWLPTVYGFPPVFHWMRGGPTR